MSNVLKMSVESYLRRRHEVQCRVSVYASISRISSTVEAAGGVTTARGRGVIAAMLEKEEEARRAADKKGERAKRRKKEAVKRVLLGVKAYNLITSEDLWREILGYL